jgi:hypothetical protein
MKCQDGIAAICKIDGGVMAQRTLSQMERKALLEARVNLAEALKRLGLVEHFMNVQPEHIDWLILEIWNGVRESMQRQSLQGDIPF